MNTIRLNLCGMKDFNCKIVAIDVISIHNSEVKKIRVSVSAAISTTCWYYIILVMSFHMYSTAYNDIEHN